MIRKNTYAEVEREREDHNVETWKHANMIYGNVHVIGQFITINLEK